jgi:hypothetical protein
MKEIINTLLVSCIPAIITSVVTFFSVSKRAKTEIASLQESNKHDIEKLMRQHEIDIESLKEKHIQDMEISEQEHAHKIEIMELQHKNQLESKEKEQSDAAMYSVMTDILTNPHKMKGLMDLANNPMFNKPQ